jgi:hypothetical protein
VGPTSHTIASEDIGRQLTRSAHLDLGLLPRLVVGDDRDLDVVEVQLTPARADEPADSAVGDVGALLVDGALPVRRAVWRCLRGASWSSVSHARMVAAWGPIAGCARDPTRIKLAESGSVQVIMPNPPSRATWTYSSAIRPG